MSAPKREIYVCMKTKHGDSCGHTGAREVLAAIQSEIELQRLGNEVRVCASKCLDACGDGPVVSIRDGARERLERFVRPNDAARLVSIEPQTVPLVPIAQGTPVALSFMARLDIRLGVRRIRGTARRIARTRNVAFFRRALAVLAATRRELQELLAGTERAAER
jgi:(2Fe-2S) ferredoxin